VICCLAGLMIILLTLAFHFNPCLRVFLFWTFDVTVVVCGYYGHLLRIYVVLRLRTRVLCHVLPEIDQPAHSK